MGKKKTSKAAPDIDELEDEESTQPQETLTEEQDKAAPLKKPGGKGKRGKGKKGKGRDWDSDEDEPPKNAVEEEDSAQIKPKHTKKSAAAASFDVLDEEFDEQADDTTQEPGLVIAKIISLERLPKSDKLKSCKISTGNSIIQVVTNAANAKSGMHVILATVGATVPSSGIVVEEKPMMGVKSQGMLCSAFNIGWLESEAGVLVELPEDSPLGEQCPSQPPQGTTLGNEASVSRKSSTSKSQAAAAAALENGELDSGLSAELESDAADALPVKPAKSGRKAKKGKAAKPSSSFAALAGDSDEDDVTGSASVSEVKADAAAALENGELDSEPSAELESEAADALPVKPAKSGRKAKKGKAAKPSSSLAALAGDSDEDNVTGSASVSEVKADAAAALENGELDSEPSAELESEAADALPVKPAKIGKKAENGHASGGFAALADDGEDADKTESAAVEIDDDEEAAFASAKPSSKKKASKKSMAASGFDALADDDDEQTLVDVNDSEPAVRTTRRKGKKHHKSASAFAALDEGTEEGNDEADAVAAAQPDASSQQAAAVLLSTDGGLAVAEDAQHPAAPEAAGPQGSAQDDAADMDSTAKPKAKQKSKGKAFDADASCAASADGAESAAGEAAAEEEPAAKPKSKKKSSKKAFDADAAFAALELAEADGDVAADPAAASPTNAAQPVTREAEEGSSVSLKSKAKKKSSRKAFDADAAFAALEGAEAMPAGDSHAAEADGHAHDAEHDVADASGAGKKKKKSKAKASDIGDVFAALEEGAAPAKLREDESNDPLDQPSSKVDGVDSTDQMAVHATTVVHSTTVANGHAEPEANSGKKKRGKHGKSKAAPAEDDDDIDAILAEIGEGPAEKAAPSQAEETKGDQASAAEVQEPDTAQEPAEAATAAAPSSKDKKKGKKKKGGKAANEDDDLDALLAEIETKQGRAAPAEQAAPAAAADAQAGPAGEAEAADDAADVETEPKELTAAQKKRLKKKGKDKAKKAGDDDDADADEPAAAATPAKGKKAAGGKKVSAAVKKMQEEMEARRAAEEEADRIEAERVLAEEEAARAAEEAEKIKAEEAEKRRQERLERRAELKKKGLLLTGKQKVEAQRLAAMREQLMAQAGLDPEVDDVSELPTRKKPVYSNKKKGPKPSEPSAAEAEAAEAAAAAEEQQRAAEEAAATAAAKRKEQKEAEDAAAAAAQAEKEKEEEAADNWEEMDVDTVKLPGQHTAEEEAPALQAVAEDAEAMEEDVPVPGKAEDDEDTDMEEEAVSGSEEESEEESTEEEDGSTLYETDEDEAAEERMRLAREKRETRLRAAMESANKEDLRSPICCILGHVDTGKTKILDNIRRTNVQDGEAGGITQQIGATYIPDSALKTRTERLRKGRDFDLRLPGLLVIDTPGHESFTNLRSRGSNLCDIAILVVDLMHGLEPQTIESIGLLKARKTPFIVALNKVDRLFEWNADKDAPIRESLEAQKPNTRTEFDERFAKAQLNLNEQGLNISLYWKNPDPRKFVNVVPTSAHTGEGIPDLLQLLVKLTQSMMGPRLMFITELQCTVLEVKMIEGFGTTIDVVLVNGVLHEGDQIVLCGLQGPIVTTIRSLLTPQPLKELRVRGSYLHHKTIKAAQGIKISAQNLEYAVAGTQMYVLGPDDDVEELKEEAMSDMTDIFSSDRSGEGVCVQASTLGSLEALLEFLKSDAVKIPVSGINIGPVNRKDIMRASVMLEKGRKKYACVLAFDVPVTKEARELAEDSGVKVFTADIIYHLFDQFTAYLKTVKEQEQEQAKFDAIFPCILKILPNCVFNKKDPIIVGVEIAEGIAKVGTPLCIPSQQGIELGRIASMELNHVSVTTAKQGQSVAMKIEPTNATESSRLYGRHFDLQDALVSKISRKSIDLLKLHFKEQMGKEDWRLILKLKKTFHID